MHRGEYWTWPRLMKGIGIKSCTTNSEMHSKFKKSTFSVKIVTNTKIGVTTFLLQRILKASRLEPYQLDMFEFENDKTSTKSIGPISSYDRKRVGTSDFFQFDTNFASSSGWEQYCLDGTWFEIFRLCKPLRPTWKFLTNKNSSDHFAKFEVEYR